VTEAVTWQQLIHPNVLPFLGIYHHNDRLGFVCPWMENGNIVTFLENTSHTDCVPLSLDVVQGLKYLHSQSIIHGDIKGLNILVSISGRACLADFGISTTKDSTRTMNMSTARGAGTLRWQAPELLAANDDSNSPTPRNTFASDVYALGMVYYEMFSGKIPFDGMEQFQAMFASMNGQRPSRPRDELCSTRGLNDAIWLLIEACWAQDPLQRPTADMILERLCALPNRPPDERPPDHFDFSSQFWGDQVKHPFSILAGTGHMDYFDAWGMDSSLIDVDSDDSDLY